MTLEYRKSLTELDMILKHMDEDYFKAIPQKFISFIKNNKDNDYIPNIKKDIPINEQQLKKDTKVLLSLFYRNFWCESEVKNNLKLEDSNVIKKYENSTQNFEEVIARHKNMEFVQDKTIDTPETVSMVEYNPKWYQRIFGKFLNFIKKNK